MTTISRKTWNNTEWKWKRIEMKKYMPNDSIAFIQYEYQLMIAGKFREVALVD